MIKGGRQESPRLRKSPTMVKITFLNLVKKFILHQSRIKNPDLNVYWYPLLNSPHFSLKEGVPRNSCCYLNKLLALKLDLIIIKLS